MLKIEPGGPSIAVSLQDLWKGKGLIYTFGAKTIVARYKQAVFGALWALANPVGNVIIFTIIFSHFMKVNSDGIPYPLFSYCAIITWNYLSTIIHYSTGSLIWSGSIIRRVYFPREVIPLSYVIVGLFDLFIAFSALVVLLSIYQIPITLTVLYIPIVLLIGTLFATGIGLVLATLNGIYRDVGYIAPILMQIWMFATPIIYSVSIIPEKYQQLYLILNPIAFTVDSVRKSLILGQSPSAFLLLVNFGVAFVCLIIGYLVFKKLEGVFADLL